jgi:hypothetical protein
VEVELLSRELRMSVKGTLKFCEWLSNHRLIDAEAWTSKQLIFIPKLKELSDEYTKKLLAMSGESLTKK